MSYREWVEDFEVNEYPIEEIVMATKKAPVKNNVSTTLNERGNRYGDFTDHAMIAQDLQDVMRGAVTTFGCKNGQVQMGWNKLLPIQKQALTVMADKIARILSGDPNYADNWHDIQGYAKLVEDRLPEGNN